MKNKYRIVTDTFLGYEVQIKYWFLPFLWFQCDFTNTHRTIDGAKEFINTHKYRKCSTIVWSE